jgi:hypothetical protein
MEQFQAEFIEVPVSQRNLDFVILWNSDRISNIMNLAGFSIPKATDGLPAK